MENQGLSFLLFNCIVLLIGAIPFGIAISYMIYMIRKNRQLRERQKYPAKPTNPKPTSKPSDKAR